MYSECVRTDIPEVDSLVGHVEQQQRVRRVQGHRHHRVLLLDAGEETETISTLAV